MAKSHKNTESPKSSAKQNVEIQQVPSTYNWGDSFIFFDFYWDLNCNDIRYLATGEVTILQHLSVFFVVALLCSAGLS